MFKTSKSLRVNPQVSNPSHVISLNGDDAYDIAVYILQEGESAMLNGITFTMLNGQLVEGTVTMTKPAYIKDYEKFVKLFEYGPLIKQDLIATVKVYSVDIEIFNDGIIINGNYGNANIPPIDNFNINCYMMPYDELISYLQSFFRPDQLSIRKHRNPITPISINTSSSVQKDNRGLMGLMSNTSDHAALERVRVKSYHLFIKDLRDTVVISDTGITCESATTPIRISMDKNDIYVTQDQKSVPSSYNPFRYNKHVGNTIPERVVYLWSSIIVGKFAFSSVDCKFCDNLYLDVSNRFFENDIKVTLQDTSPVFFTQPLNFNTLQLIMFSSTLNLTSDITTNNLNIMSLNGVSQGAPIVVQNLLEKSGSFNGQIIHGGKEI